MRVLQVATLDRSVHAFLLPHLYALQRAGYEVEVACRLHDMAVPLSETGIPVHHIPFQRSPFRLGNITAYRQLRRLIQDGNYDVVHGHLPVAGVLSRLAAHRAGTPIIIYTAHGFYFHEHGSLPANVAFHSLERWLSRYTAAIITMNDDDYRAACDWIRPDGRPAVFRVAGVGIETGAFGAARVFKSPSDGLRLRQEFGLDQDSVLVGTVGACTGRKRHGDLIDAAGALMAEFPHLHVIVVGDGPLYQQERQRSEASGFGERFHFPGFRRDVARLLACMDIYVQTSAMEGLPISIQEAMASGLPVIASEVRGNRDVVAEGETGFLFPLGDVRALRQHLRNLLVQPDLREGMGSAARNRVQRYDIASAVAETVTIYRQVTSGGQG